MDVLIEGSKYTSIAMAVVAVVVVGSLLYNWMTLDENRRNQKRLLDALPTPKGAYPYFGKKNRCFDASLLTAVIGHLLSFGGLPPGFKLKEWHDELGPVIRIQMGVQPWICISDPEIAYQLLVMNGAVASNRANHGFTAIYNARNKRGIMTSDRCTNWKNLRAALLSITSPKSVNNLSSLLEREVDDLVDSLISISCSEDGVSPLLPFKRSSLNYVLQTCFGTRVQWSEKDLLFDDLMRMLDEFTDHSAFHNDISNFIPSLSFISALRRRRKAYEKYDREIRTPVIQRLIQEAITGDQDCMLKRLFMQKAELGLDDEDLLVAATDVIVAGTDTTAVSLSWTIAILSHYPDVCKTITDEVDRFIHQHGRLPHFSERNAFPYLIAVQKEAIRYRGFAHLVIPHVLEKDVTCRGYAFPKDVLIVPITYAMHQCQDRFPDPEKFIPERFLANTDTMTANMARKVNSRDQYIFGWGRRACPGSYLAEAQMFSTMTRVFARCALQPPSNGSIPDIDDVRDTGLVLQTPPYKLRFVPREDCLLP
ncbi:cytochrome P450 [Fennellomyces sp. T-0311]|nr:cytochrome P450 [Fennellomyces sp. T-0311]